MRRTFFTASIEIFTSPLPSGMERNAKMMTNRVCTTVLVALRFFQAHRSAALVEMASLFSEELPLANAEIDQLCVDLDQRLPIQGAESASESARSRVIIVVEGGVVQSVYANQPMTVDILDHDNWEVTDRTADPAEWLRLAKLAETVDEDRAFECVY
jgi:hypothetical protein